MPYELCQPTSVAASLCDVRSLAASALDTRPGSRIYKLAAARLPSEPAAGARSICKLAAAPLLSEPAACTLDTRLATCDILLAATIRLSEPAV